MSTSLRSPNLYAAITSGQRLVFSKGEAVTSTEGGSDIMLVESGHVKRYSIANSGAHAVQIIYSAQDIFPLTKVYHEFYGLDLYDGPETYYYAAMSDLVVYRIGIDHLLAMAEQDGSLYKELFYEAGHHLKWCVHRIESSSLSNATQRVAHELVFLAAEFGRPAPAGTDFCLQITHQDLAESLGTTRATVTLAVAELRQQGAIAEGRHLIIRDVKRLTEAAYIGLGGYKSLPALSKTSMT
jgi:CRP-like cAMP-binding protein